MPRSAGWEITLQADLTANFQASLRHLIDQEEAHGEELRSLLGDADFSDKLARRRRTLAAIEQGLIRREMFGAV